MVCTKRSRNGKFVVESWIRNKKCQTSVVSYTHTMYAVRELPLKIWKRGSGVTHRAHQKGCARLLSLKARFAVLRPNAQLRYQPYGPETTSAALSSNIEPDLCP